MTVREILVSWANSEGFAAVHNGAATDEQIVDDLLAFRWKQGFIVEEQSVLTEGCSMAEFYDPDPAASED